LFGCNGRNLLRRSRPTLPCRRMKENEQRVLSTAAGFGAIEEVEVVGST
jgi:hypothetical protein